MSGGWTEIKLLLSLAFVVLLAYAAIRMLGRKSAVLSAGVGPVQNVGALPLGPGKSLQVVVVDRRTVLLLGIAANVECVARFDDAQLADRLLAEVDRTRPGFLVRALSNWWRTRRPTRPDGFADLLRERLRASERQQDRPDNGGGGDAEAAKAGPGGARPPEATPGPGPGRKPGAARDPDSGGDGR